MLESRIKELHILHMQKDGWMPIGLIQTTLNGIPDKAFMKYPARIIFVEYKKPGIDEPATLQQFRMQQLRELGFECYFVNSINFPDIR